MFCTSFSLDRYAHFQPVILALRNRTQISISNWNNYPACSTRCFRKFRLTNFYKIDIFQSEIRRVMVIISTFFRPQKTFPHFLFILTADETYFLQKYWLNPIPDPCPRGSLFYSRWVPEPVMKIPPLPWEWNPFLIGMLQILPRKLLTGDDSYLSW